MFVKQNDEKEEEEEDVVVEVIMHILRDQAEERRTKRVLARNKTYRLLDLDLHNKDKMMENNTTSICAITEKRKPLRTTASVAVT